jgi:pyridoxine kinase
MAGVVIAISSHVAEGSVGNRAMVFALERLGFETISIPTIVLPHHPGRGPVERIVPEHARFDALLYALVRDRRAWSVAGIVTGYLADAAQAAAVAALIEAVKSASPDALYLCDPVLGDDSGLYVAEALAEAIRDRLMPLADIATPNAFECAWLAGPSGDEEKPDLTALARSLPPPAILVTSAPAMMRGHIGNLLVTAQDAILFENPRVASPAKGTGDLLAALLLARLLKGMSLPKATELALSSVFEIVAGTAKAGAGELMLAALQDSIAAPQATVLARRLHTGFRR